MSFFKQFPNTTLQIGNQRKRVVDLFRHVDVNDILSSDISNYLKVRIHDGERPDNLSQRLYGTTDYYWTFFILNGSLTNLSDWPKASVTIEKEFTNEFDNIATLTFNPSISNQIVKTDGTRSEDGTFSRMDFNHLRNTFAGLDLSYPGLKVYRNFETADIVKWDNKTNQLLLTNFTNKARFLGDVNDFNFRNELKSIPIATEFGDGTWTADESTNGSLTFTFDDWPIIGKNSANGEVDPEDGTGGRNPSTSGFYYKTMTEKRIQWIIHLFEWFDSMRVDQNLVLGKTNGTPLAEYLKDKPSKGMTQAALDVFYEYFIPYYRNGFRKFSGFFPYYRTDGNMHKFSSLRNAPCYYYNGQPLNKNDIVSANDAFNGVTNADGTTTNINLGIDYVSHYQKEIAENDNKSLIKVIKPELISEFSRQFKKKLNAGLTRVTPFAPSVSAPSSTGGGNGGSVGGATTTPSGTGGSAPTGGGTSGGTSSY